MQRPEGANRRDVAKRPKIHAASTHSLTPWTATCAGKPQPLISRAATTAAATASTFSVPPRISRISSEGWEPGEN